MPLLVALIALTQARVIEAVTFASKPGIVYVPVQEAATLLGWRAEHDTVVDLIKLKGQTLDPLEPQLSNGTQLISLADLGRLGAKVTSPRVMGNSGGFQVKISPKRVSVDLSGQVLRAWQGSRLVYQWPVSSGREGKDTPNGDFRAQEKEPMHISKIYGSPMPFSVHMTGNIYIHGSDRFSSNPGSHGCIRLPLMETRNVAEEFYNWIEPGVPIKIRGAFNFHKKSS